MKTRKECGCEKDIFACQNHAHLIAAAPELLKMLKKVRFEMAGLPSDPETLDMIDKTIAKAEGR